MLELKMNDVRLRGCGFTLFPAATEAGLTENSMHTILFALHIQLFSQYGESAKEENPNFPKKIEIKHLEAVNHWCSVEDLINFGLVKQCDESTVELTEKAIAVLENAAKKQKELDDEGFYFCPCQHF